MQFTLVSTIYNEAERLEQTISDIKAQTLQPDEIIITDAGSTDGSIEILKKWKAESDIPVKIIIEKGCNVARGRNLAIEAAKYELIASTDFGCRFEPDWIETLLSPVIKEKKEVDVIGGAFTVNEKDITTLSGKSDYILQGGYNIKMDETFSVSSRSIAYKKEVWKKAGGYPEWLTLAADDTIFWKILKKLNIKYTFVKEPKVYWERHKTNKAFAKEAFRYGLGDGESRINFKNFWSNVIETGLRYVFFVSITILTGAVISNYIFNSPDTLLFKLLILLVFLTLPGLRSYINAYKSWRTVKSKKYDIKAFINALLQLELCRIYYIKGYIKGILDKDIKKKKGREQLSNILYK